MLSSKSKKKVYQRKIYSLVEKKLIRCCKTGDFYLENAPHIRIDGKLFYGMRGVDYILENTDDPVIEDAEEMN